MRRELPDRPHLDHLKRQAKELLDGHRQADPTAIRRIRESLPAFSHYPDQKIMESPLALHDAQSVIAREYGFASWAKLRERVLSPRVPFPAEFLQRLLGQPLPLELDAALRETWTRVPDDQLADIDTPAVLPVLPVRNALMPAGALAPFALARPSSLAALEAAGARTPSLVAVFTQRAVEDEAPGLDGLHPIGCLALIRRFKRANAQGWVVLEGIRWVRLDALVSTEPYYEGRVSEFEIEDSAEPEAEELERALREAARKLAAALPNAETLVRVIDETEDAGRLADLVVVNLPCSVADKADYAAEHRAVERLRRAIALLQAFASQAPPAPRAP
jgi:Lon protease-like protein